MARDEDRGGKRRLDAPLTNRRDWRNRFDAETFGAISEGIARFIGSWRFIAYMSVFIAGWVIWNVVADQSVRPDGYPFIFLTLLLSLQASYAAPLILLAQNRQADRERVAYGEDRQRAEQLRSEMEFLSREIAALRIAMGEVVTRDFLRGELRDLLDEISNENLDEPKN